jgi:periplasmic protein TonB
MPARRDDWRIGSILSVLVHLAVVLVLISPLAVLADPTEIAQGAGGPGPAGGGGGGSRFRQELLKFVQVAAAPTPPPTPKPIPQPKIEVKPPEPEAIKLPEPSVTASASAGTGQDNTPGSGPGTGGGTGSGTGTGAGSAVGPGTGGGNQPNYPPTPIEMFIPPLPVPSGVKGFHLIAEFDIDERGKVLGMTFTQTRDRGYNRRLEDVLKGFRFKPGTRADGTPIRMKTQVVVDLY